MKPLRTLAPVLAALLLATTAAAQDPCGTASPPYTAQCQEIDQWLDQKLVQWKPDAWRPMMFTAVDWPLETSLAKYGDIYLDDLFLDAMLELGVNAVYFSILPQGYDAYSARYAHAAARIKGAGKTLIVSYNVMGGEDATFPRPPTIDEYIEIAKQYIERYLNDLGPVYLLVAVEPYTLNARIGRSWGPAEWTRIIGETSAWAKAIAPDVRIGAALTIMDFGIFDEIKSMSSLDVLGFNIYGNYRIYDEYQDAVCTGDCVGSRLDELRALGKEPWVFETWACSFTSDPASFYEPWRVVTDPKWITVMAYYAQKHGANNVMPFFSGKLIVDTGVFDFRRLEAGLESGNRTTSFFAFRDVILAMVTSSSPRPPRRHLHGGGG